MDALDSDPKFRNSETVILDPDHWWPFPDTGRNSRG
jgi:hypothetical protein